MAVPPIPPKYTWAYTDWSRPSDPINVIFINIYLEEIQNYLEIERNWEVPGLFASDQYIPVQNIINSSSQNLQLVKRIDSFHFTRYHARFWNLTRYIRDVRCIIVAGVHLDRFRGTGHVSADFESIEDFFANECRQNSVWQVTYDEYEIGNRFAGYELPYNDGRATVVRRKRK
jgi:hypothetical protein